MTFPAIRSSASCHQLALQDRAWVTVVAVLDRQPLVHCAPLVAFDGQRTPCVGSTDCEGRFLAVFIRVHLMKQFGAHIYAAPSIGSESIKWQKRLTSAKSIRRTI